MISGRNDDNGLKLPTCSHFGDVLRTQSAETGNLRAKVQTVPPARWRLAVFHRGKLSVEDKEEKVWRDGDGAKRLSIEHFLARCGANRSLSCSKFRRWRWAELRQGHNALSQIRTSAPHLNAELQNFQLVHHAQCRRQRLRVLSSVAEQVNCP
jgi:hypothetical protein